MKSILIAMVLISSLSPALANEGSIQATTSVAGNCIVTAPSTLDFGQYDPTGANLSSGLNASFTIGVQCTGGTPQTLVYIDKGQNDSAGCTNSTRRMKGLDSNNTGSYLGYNITKDISGTQGWGCAVGGDTHGGVFVGPFVDSRQTLSLTAYGSIPGGQGTAVVGDYSDQLSVFINF